MDFKEQARILADEGSQSASWRQQTTAERMQTTAGLHTLVKNWMAPESVAAVIALLNLDDAEAIAQTLQIYRSNTSIGLKRSRMANIMKKCQQLSLIPLLANDIQNEDPIILRRKGEFLSYPIAYDSSEIILAILTNTRECPPEITMWATENKKLEPEKLVDSVRRFWKLNREAIVDQNYGAIKIAE